MLSNVLSPEVRDHILQLKAAGKKIVLVSGVFDLLHQEHRIFLEKSRALGDVVIIVIESDVRVRQIKGEWRPINSQEKRKKQLEELGLAELVVILPEDFGKPELQRQLIAEVLPDIFAVSSHTSHLEKKRQVVESFGGQLIIAHQHNPEVSTTQMLARGLEK